MKRSSAVIAAIVAGLPLVAASAASAQIIELGGTKSPLVAPTCPPKLTPGQCTIVLTRATALATIRDGVTYPTTVTTAGQIVAFTVGLSNLSTNATTRRTYIHKLDVGYGGTTQLVLTVLKPTGPKNLRRWSVVTQTPVFHVQPFLGEVVQFPLQTTLSVVPGETIALTTPTWAPVLSILQPQATFAYRQSRRLNCNNTPSISQAQLTIGQLASYGCNYPGTRVEYSATEVTTPVPPKTAVHGRRQFRPRVIRRAGA